MTKGTTHHTTQYAVRLKDGNITPPAPSLEYAEQQIEIARELALTDPTYLDTVIVSRVITTTRTEWEVVDPEPKEEIATPVLAEDRTPKRRGRPKKVADA